MSTKRRFFNIYLTTTLSVAMVLLLIGLEAVLLLSSSSLIHRVKENMAITLVLKNGTDTAALASSLQAQPFCHHLDYISAEQALQEHIEYLGEDPSKFLGYNPLSSSYELHLCADYVNPDSMGMVKQQLATYPAIERVVWQQDLMQVMHQNIHELSIILIGLAIILLIVAMALIVNTVRLHIYSKRFLINTMTLVGATAWVIKAPIVRTNMLMGLVASGLAAVALAAVVYYVNIRLGVLLFPLSAGNILLIIGTLVVAGVLITGIASLFATGHYIRMKTDALYEI